jgi:hypothetical protein
MFNNLFEFYRSKEWADFRKIVIAERIREDGFIYDEYTNKPIVKAYDIILHHKEELTEENVFDYNVSLNPDNIMIVSHKSHNLIHNKLNSSCRKVYLVYGAPLSGKTSWVKDNMIEGDLVVDMDSIWQCVSGLERYIKPKRLNAVVFKLRDTLLDSVKYRLGKWKTAYIIGGYPLTAERERLCHEMGAEEVLIDTPKEECLRRLEADEARSSIEEYKGFIEEWFERYTRPVD